MLRWPYLLVSSWRFRARGRLGQPESKYLFTCGCVYAVVHGKRADARGLVHQRLDCRHSPLHVAGTHFFEDIFARFRGLGLELNDLAFIATETNQEELTGKLSQNLMWSTQPFGVQAPESLSDSCLDLISCLHLAMT